MRISRIKEARVKYGLSQEDLANKIGVSRQTINLIERGNHNPSIKTCQDICRELNLTLNEVFGADVYFPKENKK